MEESKRKEAIVNLLCPHDGQMATVMVAPEVSRMKY